MTTSVIIVTLLAYCGLVALAGFSPKPPTMSRFELTRRVKQKDIEAKNAQERRAAIDDVMTLVRVARAIIIIIFICFAVISFGWLFGVIVGLVGLLSYESLAHIRQCHALCQRVHRFLEPRLFTVAIRYASYLKPFRGFAAWSMVPPAVHSREELTHIIERAAFLSNDEQRYMVAGLKAPSLPVMAAITPLDKLTTITEDELVGPLLLHELHATGDEVFPVVRGKNDATVVGILEIATLVTLENKTSPTVKDCMKTDVLRFKPEMMLDTVIKKLTAERAFMGIVEDDGVVIGFVTLATCFASLVSGRNAKSTH